MHWWGGGGPSLMTTPILNVNIFNAKKQTNCGLPVRNNNIQGFHARNHVCGMGITFFQMIRLYLGWAIF